MNLSVSITIIIIKAVTKKEGQKKILAAPFLNPFSQLPAVKKDSRNVAARKFFGPSYFDPALATDLVLCSPSS